MAEEKENKGLHVAIIMDGNGRWGETRFGKRVEGHRRGAQRVKEIIQHADSVGISVLTLWGFSTENWNRPQYEIDVLMHLFKRYIIGETEELHSMNVHVTFIGDRSRLPGQLQNVMNDLEQKTKLNRGLHVQIALNYGGRDEIIRALKKVVQSGEEVTEESFSDYLDTVGVSDPDLIIRTSGEKRLSGFMLWQAASSELVFMEEQWPDFTPAHFDEALAEFKSRDRRFGGLSKKAI